MWGEGNDATWPLEKKNRVFELSDLGFSDGRCAAVSLLFAPLVSGY
jgi:hypothetical protein